MKKSTARKFGAYSVIGIAGGMTFAASSAEADIIFADIQDTATSGNAASIDLDGDSNIDIIFDLREVGPNIYGTIENWAAVSAQGSNQFAFVNPSPADGGEMYGPNNIAFGGSISGQEFVGGVGPMQLAYVSYNPGNVYGAFAPGQNSGYVGIQFITGTGETAFGWIGVSIDGDVSDGNFRDASITINGAAFATGGTAIAAGQTSSAVPEPNSIGLLALGAVGILARRRKNRKDQ